MKSYLLRSILGCLAICTLSNSLLYSIEKAIRPDAPQLGSSLFGPEMACVSVTNCCPDVNANGCSPIVISETGFVQTLTDSGTYCLATDLTFPLIISGSSITLNMNGHTIFVPTGTDGILITGGASDVRVHNGLLDGQFALINNGISIATASNVRLEDITCQACDRGILANTAEDLVINRVLCSFNGQGIGVQASSKVQINDSNVSNSSTEGIVIATSQSVGISATVSQLNTIGFVVNIGAQCEFVGCTARSNTEDGFLLSLGSTDIILRECSAINNTERGFDVTVGVLDVSFFNCTAERNGEDGFFTDGTSAGIVWSECTATFNGAVGNENGFTVGSATSLVRNSIATNNAGYGFADGTGTNQFYSNVACDNALGNYFGVTSAPIAGPASATGVDNVDCSILTPPSGVCSVIIVSETFAPQTLSLAGRYCLATDLNFPLTIDGSSITLDMNGHTIFVPAGVNGITISGASQITDIRVFSGLINGQGNGANNGIFITNVVDGRIEDVTAINCDYGIYLAGAGSSSGGMALSPINTTINRVDCSNNSLAGLFCQGDFSTSVNDSIFGLNGVGIITDESDSLTVSRSVISENTGTAGFELSGSVSCELRNCIANKNNTVGFLVSGSFATVLRDCDASSNVGIGFSITNSSTDASLFNCAAEANNTDGFSVGDSSEVLVTDCKATNNTGNGFSFLDPSVAMVRNCNATSNIGFGFQNAVDNNQFYSNAACKNIAGNYDGVVSAEVAGPFNANGADNIDCEDTSLISNCEATPIFNTNATQVLAESGRYCLAEDITAADGTNVLEINADSISVDLNGYTINVPADIAGVGGVGISVSPGINDVRIYNGLIDGGGEGLRGIDVGLMFDIRIEDITCRSLSIGIFSSAQNMVVNRVIIENNTQGIVMSGVLSGEMNDCLAQNNGSGIEMVSSTSLAINGCSCIFNNGNGFSASALSGGLEFTDCSATGNAGDGFFTSTAQDLVFRNCVSSLNNNANLNGYGFNITSGSTGLQFISCIANGNFQDGFFVDGSSVVSLVSCGADTNNVNGFTIVSPGGLLGTTLVQNCSAMNNGAYGFSDGTGTNQFYSNVACGNVAGNYTGVVSAPVAGPANAVAVENIDCSDTSSAPNCEATPIFNTNATQTLSVPGRYCLAEDITAAGSIPVISIAVSGVWLDLNGHTITISADGDSGWGIDVASVSDIHIYNGRILGSGIADSAGIFVLNASTDVSIEDVIIGQVADQPAIFLDSVERVIIRRVDIHDSFGGAIFCAGTKGVSISDSVMGNNFGGVHVLSSTNTLISGCTITQSLTEGIRIDGGGGALPCKGTVVVNCISNSNSVGIFVTDGSFTTGTELINCVADLNTQDGFNIDAPSVVTGCIAQYNGGDGFDIGAAAVTSIISNCTAKTNTGFGFKNAAAANQFYQNMACNNTANNYSGVVTAAQALPDLATAWQNVACTLP